MRQPRLYLESGQRQLVLRTATVPAILAGDTAHRRCRQFGGGDLPHFGCASVALGAKTERRIERRQGRTEEQPALHAGQQGRVQ